MTKEVTLQDVTADNWEQVADLEISEHQEDFVADNAYSIAESKFNPYAFPRAVYAGDELVGFLMYESLTEEGKPHDYSIYRLMIDEQFQGEGYGRAALELALSEIRRDPEWNRITICYVPENEVSRQFYSSVGFVEVGLNDEEEMLAEIVRDRQ